MPVFHRAQKAGLCFFCNTMLYECYLKIHRVYTPINTLAMLVVYYHKVRRHIIGSVAGLAVYAHHWLVLFFILKEDTWQQQIKKTNNNIYY